MFNAYITSIKKIMKKIILASIIAFCHAHISNGQNTIPKNVIVLYPKELIANLVYPVSGNANTELYMLGYRRLLNKKNALRLGAYGNLINTINDRNDTLNNSNKTNAIMLGLGFERYATLSKAWQCNYGADYLWGNSKGDTYYRYVNNITTESYQTYNTKKTNGVYVFVGCIVQFNKTISAGLETGFKITSNVLNDKYIYNYTNKPTVITTQNGTSTLVEFIKPSFSLRMAL
jgi:hypothetical protein